MGKKILLIYPPSELINREDYLQQPIKNLLFSKNIIPTDLMYLASIAEKTGFEAKINIYDSEKIFKNDLKEFNPDYLLINVNTLSIESDLKILKTAKKINPKLVTIVKGIPFLSCNTDYLYKFKDLDLIIVGEAEDTFNDILKEIPCNEIPGLCYKDGFVARYTGLRNFIENLEVLPFPARHLVDNTSFKCPFTNKVQAEITISRGCPHHCFFCLCSPVSGEIVRIRSSENIIAEIRECIRNYKIKHFLFNTNNFGTNRVWAINFCNQIIKSKLNITWTTNLRADNIDEKLAKLMYKAGCRVINLGVESGSQYILDKIRKNLTLNEIRNAVKIIRKAKIKLHNTFILGFPWDDEQTCNMTIDFAIELESDFVSFYSAVPLLGSSFYNYIIKQNLSQEVFHFENAYFKPVIKTFSLSKEALWNIYKKAYKSFYIRPLRIFKTLLNLKSFNDLVKYLKFGMSLYLQNSNNLQDNNKLISLKYFHKHLQNK